MKKINFLIVVAVTSLILLVTYLLNDSTNIGFIAVYISIVICVYIALHRMSEKVEGNTYSFKDYFNVPQMKKRYIVYFSVLGYLTNNFLSMVYTKCFGLPNNEIRVQDKYDNQSTFEMELYGGIQAPIVEEIIFRGLLFLVIVSVFKVISDKSKHVNAMNTIFLVVSSGLFGLMHTVSWGKLIKTMTLETDIKHVTPYLIAGVIYSSLYLITKTLCAPIMAHMLNNLTDLQFDYTVMFLGIMLFVLYVIYVYRTQKGMPINKWLFVEDNKAR